MIPSSRLVPTSLNKGRPVVIDEPTSDVSLAVRQLAQRFIGVVESPEVEAAAAGRGKKRKLFTRT
jgi:MinD-like ATPase involved in chromosome partitioning or flagellar assembly